MSAPPLPEVFGNYALGDFVELVSPQSVSWLPQTTGWWWVGAALLALLLRHSWRRLQHWYKNRYRREAAARLQALPQNTDGAAIITQVNKLLKLAAMAAYSRDRVARLSGQEWIAFLNQQCATAPFSPPQQDLLAKGVYRGQSLETGDASALIAASLNWVREHRGNTDV